MLIFKHGGVMVMFRQYKLFSVFLILCLTMVVFIPLFSVSAVDSKWQLTWSDEFNTPDNSGPDRNKWVFEIGDGYGGFGNGELEYYTDRLENAHIEKGSLIITARKETYEEYWEYTSARIKTKGKFEQTYGRFEARIKLPYGQGLWPAFWMSGSNYDQEKWPKCGEIDIMEYSGKLTSKISGTIHGPGYSGTLGLGAPLVAKVNLSDDYHIYAVEWEPDAIRWYLDDTLFQTRTPNDLNDKTKWVFDHPFFIILNMAVGGYYPGKPDETTKFPQQMAIDYIRVYSKSK